MPRIVHRPSPAPGVPGVGFTRCVVLVVVTTAVAVTAAWGTWVDACWVIILCAMIAAMVIPAGAAVFLWHRPVSLVTGADRVTLVRVFLSGLLSGAAVFMLTGEVATRSWMIAVPAALCLSLDAVDGWVARRTGRSTATGARLDMQADAACLVVLCVLAAPTVGWWVLSLGLMRYLFAGLGRLRPQLQADLPPSALRRPVAAAQGICVLSALIPIIPVWLAVTACAVALIALTASFSVDIARLEHQHQTSPTHVNTSERT